MRASQTDINYARLVTKEPFKNNGLSRFVLKNKNTCQLKRDLPGAGQTPFITDDGLTLYHKNFAGRLVSTSNIQEICSRWKTRNINGKPIESVGCC